MKFLLASLFIFSTLFAAPQDEVVVIQELIEATKKSLEQQQELLKLTVEFNQAREAFLEDPDSGKLATLLVKRAMRLQKLLEKEHLVHLFSSDFLMELSFYNQVGKQYLVHD